MGDVEEMLGELEDEEEGKPPKKAKKEEKGDGDDAYDLDLDDVWGSTG